MVQMFSWNINRHPKKKIIVKEVRTFKLWDGNKLNSLYKVTLPYVITDIKVNIITDVVDSDIPLHLPMMMVQNGENWMSEKAKPQAKTNI